MDEQFFNNKAADKQEKHNNENGNKNDNQYCKLLVYG